MPRYLTTVFLLVLLAGSALSQDEEAAGEVGITAAEEAADEVIETPADAAAVTDEEEVDDSDLDEQTYEEDDDDFVPTEEIPADEPIPFPSNI